METRKLIVTDLDGTALQNWETLDPKTKEALMKAKEEGLIVVLQQDAQHVRQSTSIKN